MKYIKRFNEAIINHRNSDIDGFIDKLRKLAKEKKGKTHSPPKLSIEELSKMGEEFQIEVVDYDTFFNDLADEDKSTAPPRYAQFFALVNITTNRPRLVFSGTNLFSYDFIEHIEGVLGHEMIHVAQHNNRTGKKKEIMVNPKNNKDYFSDKDEIMAFSYSVAQELVNRIKPKSVQDAMKKLRMVPLYQHIASSIDKKVLQKYHKYIYLYLEDLIK